MQVHQLAASQPLAPPHLLFFRMRRICGRLRMQLPAITSHPTTTASLAAKLPPAGAAAAAADVAAVAITRAAVRCRGCLCIGLHGRCTSAANAAAVAAEGLLAPIRWLM